MNYTKGEWKVQHYNKNKLYVISDYSQIAQMLYTETRGMVGTPEQREANAHLISAAPEMYKALKTVREQVANFLYPKVKLLSSKELIVLMDKALAKAEGKENK